MAEAEQRDRQRRDRARARPRRPQGGRQGLHHRPGRRQVRSDGRGDRARQGAGRQAGRRGAQGARAPHRRAQLPASVLDDLRELFERYPGETEIVLEIHTRTGVRRLKLGEAYRVQARDAGLRAELDALLGVASRSRRASRAASPRERRSYAHARSTGSGPLASRPGPSKIIGSPSNRGSDRTRSCRSTPICSRAEVHARRSRFAPQRRHRAVDVQSAGRRIAGQSTLSTSVDRLRPSDSVCGVAARGEQRGSGPGRRRRVPPPCRLRSISASRALVERRASRPRRRIRARDAAPTRAWRSHVTSAASVTRPSTAIAHLRAPRLFSCSRWDDALAPYAVRRVAPLRLRRHAPSCRRRRASPSSGGVGVASSRTPPARHDPRLLRRLVALLRSCPPFALTRGSTALRSRAPTQPSPTQFTSARLQLPACGQSLGQAARSAGRRPTPCRRARASLPARPGPSKITGSPSKRGSERNAIMPSTPISPSPRFA